jgi:F0F1-type ATP synthase assembly protein I
MRRVIGLQAVVLIAASLTAATFWGVEVAKSAWFGAVISLCNSLLIAWRMKPSAQEEQTAQRHLRQFYRSWIERYVVLFLMFALALIGLKLLPAALLSGFVLAQAVWIIAPLTFVDKEI